MEAHGRVKTPQGSTCPVPEVAQVLERRAGIRKRLEGTLSKCFIEIVSVVGKTMNRLGFFPFYFSIFAKFSLIAYNDSKFRLTT